MAELTPSYIILCIFVMFCVTYGLRMIPIVFSREKFKSRFIFSFLTYTPYGVLAAMIFPDIFLFTATGTWPTLEEFICAAAGGAVAVILSLLKGGLTTVSLGAVAAVYIAQKITEFIM